MINYKNMATTDSHPLFGVFDNKFNCHYVGSTQKSVKAYATKNNFCIVWAIYPSDTVIAVSEKVNGKWVSILDR